MNELTVNYKENLAQQTGRALAFPAIEKFSELFSQWRRYDHPRTQGFGTVNGVSDYCHTTQTRLRKSLHVKPRQFLISYITKNMVLAEDDSWYFEIIQRADGLLVVVKNNAIIASRWLALLDSEQGIKEIQNEVKLVYRVS